MCAYRRKIKHMDQWILLKKLPYDTMRNGSKGKLRNL